MPPKININADAIIKQLQGVTAIRQAHALMPHGGKYLMHRLAETPEDEAALARAEAKRERRREKYRAQ